MKYRDILKILNADGWYLDKTKGSHRQLKHNSKQGRVTVPGKPSQEIPEGTLNSILKQSALEIDKNASVKDILKALKKSAGSRPQV